ncbi:MAG: hypothetical protein LBB79_02415 [Prevotellaceae bacterium]|jgi:hypothetical protein|nr:hypothetical protein [Prevotellaceae bacterium]
MGRSKKDGHSYMQAVGIIKKIDDIPALKDELITLGDGKTHREMSKYGLLLAEHILEVSKVERFEAIDECFAVNERWQAGEVKFQDARNVAFKLHRLAREEKNPVREKALRVMGQVAATPHVKHHALVASEYAVKLINLMYPKNLDEVRREREMQIELMKSV